MTITTKSQNPDEEPTVVYFTDADGKGIKRRRIGQDNHRRKKTYEEVALTILPGMTPSTGARVPNSQRMEVVGRNPGAPDKHIELSRPISPLKSPRKKQNRPKQTAREEICHPPAPQGEESLALHSPAREPNRSAPPIFNSPIQRNLLHKFQMLQVDHYKKVLSSNFARYLKC